MSLRRRPEAGVETAGRPATAENSGVTRLSDLVFGRIAILPEAAKVDVPTRRRAGVFRRALRHEISRIRDPRRLLMMVILGCVAGLVLAGLLARGEAAGADTRAYWAAVDRGYG